MKTPATFTRRHLMIAIITTLASAGNALAGVCRRCGGSGTTSFACFSCKGTGFNGNMKCTFCNGKGFDKCPNCSGTGQSL